MDIKKKREYQTRYSNWQIIASYLLELKSYEEVFKCFNFPTKTYSRKITLQFDGFLNDIKLPEELRKFCGQHLGGEPDLGRILDQMVFVKLYKEFIRKNMEDNTTPMIYISNEIINKAVSILIMEADENCLTVLKRNAELKNFDYKSFVYSKAACNRFAHRWDIPDRYVIEPTIINNFANHVGQSDYAVSKRYPVQGWDNIKPTVTLHEARLNSTITQMAIIQQEQQTNPFDYYSNNHLPVHGL